jgi:plastocyanin
VSRRRTLPAALAAVVALLCAAPAGAGDPQRKTVKVFDNYYLPLKLTVNKGSTITWKWPTDVAIDVHDVKLKSGPEGVRRFHSEPASTGYRYRRTLRKPGRYDIVCTLHEEMTMTIRVRRG